MRLRAIRVGNLETTIWAGVHRGFTEISANGSGPKSTLFLMQPLGSRMLRLDSILKQGRIHTLSPELSLPPDEIDVEAGGTRMHA